MASVLPYHDNLLNIHDKYLDLKSSLTLEELRRKELVEDTAAAAVKAQPRRTKLAERLLAYREAVSELWGGILVHPEYKVLRQRLVARLNDPSDQEIDEMTQACDIYLRDAIVDAAHYQYEKGLSIPRLYRFISARCQAELTASRNPVEIPREAARSGVKFPTRSYNRQEQAEEKAAREE